MSVLRSIWALKGYWLAVALIQAIDIALGNQISFWVPLLIPIGLATWNRGARYGVAIAVVCALAVPVQGLVYGNPFTAVRFLVFSAVSEAVVMALVVWLVAQLREQQVERVRVRREDRTAHGVWRTTR